MSPTPSPRVPVLRLAGIRKAFGATVALAGVDLQVAAGEVLAVLGQNGAGKTTLVKILAGALAADAGVVELAGERFAPPHPAAARASSVAVIHQELSVVPHLSVVANISLGCEPTRFGLERRAAMAARARSALALLGHEGMDLGQRMDALGTGARQLVEIARALAHDARLLVLDEPTSSLAGGEVERLLAVVRHLAGQGLAIIYISHWLEELRRVADRFVVLRDGRTVATGPMAGTSVSDLTEAMVGGVLHQALPPRRSNVGEVVLAARALQGEPLPDDASFELRAGEVLGIAGLCGAGRTELLRTLFGLAKVRGGKILVHGRPDCGASPQQRWAQGIGMVAEDRKAEGLALAQSVAVNLTLTRMHGLTRFGWLRRARRDAAAAPWIRQLGIKVRGPRQAVGDLSGGNQQKVALARLLHHDADTLLLDEPTRGIDVATRAEIYTLIGALAARGKAVLLVSSQLPELLGLADRIAVMHRGRLSPARPVAEWTEATLLAASAGANHG